MEASGREMTRGNTDPAVISRAGKAKMIVILVAMIVILVAIIIEGEGKATIAINNIKVWVISTASRMKTMAIPIKVVSETKTIKTISTETITKETATKATVSPMVIMIINPTGKTTP